MFKRILFIVAFACALPALAAQVTAVADADWSQDTTWNPVGVPSLSDDVVIDGFTVTISSSANVSSLTIKTNGTLLIAPSPTYCTITGDVVNNGTLWIQEDYWHSPFWNSILQITGTYTQQPQAIYQTFLAGNQVPGVDYGQLQVNGEGDIFGAFVYYSARGYVREQGQYDIFTRVSPFFIDYITMSNVGHLPFVNAH